MLSIRRVRHDLVIFGNGNIRSVTAVLLTLALPILFMVLFGAIFAGASVAGGTVSWGSSTPTIYIQNRDSGNVSQAFINALKNTNATNIVMVDTSQDLHQYLLSHSASDGIMIPASFSTDYWRNARVNVTIYGNPASQSSPVIFGVVSYIVNSFNLRRAGGISVIGTNSQTVTSSSHKYIDFLVPGLIGYTILASPMFAMVNISSQYKRDKIFKELSLTPLTKTEWLISKNLWYMAITVASFLLMVPVGIYLFGAQFILSPGLFIFLLLGPFLFVSLGMLVGSLANSVESAALIGNVVTFPMMFLSGTFFPLAVMPQYLQSLARVLPLFYVIDGLNSVMIYSNISQALFDIGILASTSVLVFALAVKFFKWRED